MVVGVVSIHIRRDAAAVSVLVCVGGSVGRQVQESELGLQELREVGARGVPQRVAHGIDGGGIGVEEQ